VTDHAELIEHLNGTGCRTCRDAAAAIAAEKERADKAEAELARLTADPVSWREETFRLRMTQAELDRDAANEALRIALRAQPDATYPTAKALARTEETP
jgi:hypothetical protein